MKQFGHSNVIADVHVTRKQMLAAKWLQSDLHDER